MTPITPPPSRNRIYPARNFPEGPATVFGAANVVLGIWLFLSAFLWTHTPGSQTNTWVVGLFIAAAGIIGMYTPSVRWVNAVAAVWLFSATLWLYDATPPTIWNNAIVAVAVFVLSLMPTESRTRPRMG